MIAQSSGDMCHKRLGAHTHAIRSVTNYPLFLGKHFKMVLAPKLSQSTKERKSLVFEKKDGCTSWWTPESEQNLKIFG